MESPYAPLSESCAKALGDKVYDKRKLASQEIEKMVTEFNINDNSAQINKLINVLSNDFATSLDANRRKGGLIGLAATSLGLGTHSGKYVNKLVTPILNCLSDPDVKVRYFACESLYNVVKVSRGAIIPYFPDLFTALSKLVTDSDQMVKDGSELLDRLLKDIVTEASSSFDLEAFIPLLRERIYVNNQFARHYIISWISVLNAVPEINMVVYITDILDGLFLMLEDDSVEIQRKCETTIGQFLKAVRTDPSSIKMENTINILIPHAQSSKELVKRIAINWIYEFVQIFGADVLPYASTIFTAILPCFGDSAENKRNIKDCAASVDKAMLALISSEENKKENLEKMDLSSIMDVLSQYLNHNSVETKVAVLKWMHRLFNYFPNEIFPHSSALQKSLLYTLADNSDEVVKQCLLVQAQIISSKEKGNSSYERNSYRTFLIDLLNFFNEDKKTLENKACLIIRQLCVHLDPEIVYGTLAMIILDDEIDYKYAPTMVRLFHSILMTSPELFDLRNAIRDITNPKSADLFRCLYRSWIYCPVSTLSLCLLAQCYEHVSELVVFFAEIEMTLELLTEFDKLVQLIESPIFAALRLTLVSKKNNGADAQFLANALFGILMLLPQTEAFHLLKNRLQCVPNYWRPNSETKNESLQAKSGIDFEKLLKLFIDMQKSIQDDRIKERKKSFILPQD